MEDRNPKRRILVIDPDGEIEQMLRHALTGTECEISRALIYESLHDTVVYRYPFDLVVLNLTGKARWLLDMVYILRRLHPDVVALTMSRSADERMWIDVLDRGGSDLLTIPPDRNELRRVLLKALNLDQAENIRRSADAA